MLNGNILVKDITKTTTTTESGFVDKKESMFKDLEVVLSTEEGISKGDVVKVKKTSGEKIEIPEGEYVVIQSRDIIMVL